MNYYLKRGLLAFGFTCFFYGFMVFLYNLTSLGELPNTTTCTILFLWGLDKSKGWLSNDK